MAAAAACVLAAPGLSAARLPGWAHAVAGSAPAAGAVSVNDSIYMLLSEEHVAVRPDGTFLIRQRYATQILSARQRRLSYRFPFNKDARVLGARAWHLLPGRDSGGEGLAPVDVHVEESELTGQSVRTVQMEGLLRGSIVFFEFETSLRPSLLTLSKRFFEDAPVREARLEVQTPEGWAVRHTWVRKRGPEPEIDGGVRVWRILDLPAPVSEPMAEPASMKAPQLAINLVPPPGAAVGTPAVPDWKTFSAWYEGLARGADAVTADVASLADRVLPRGDAPGGLEPAVLAAAAGTARAGDASREAAGELARIRDAARWVRDHIRYVPPRRGVGGSLLPRPAGVTLSSGYGDCKDMGTLLRALLASRGIRSHALLVHASEGETLSEEVPAWGFDHYVVAVPLAAGEEIPAHFAGAILDAGDLGPMLVIDVTHTDQSVGSLSAALAGKRGLLVAGDDGRLVSLPAAGPAAHRLERRVVAERRPDQSVAITVITRLLGEPAVSARADRRASSGRRQAEAGLDAAEGWPGAVVTGYAVRPETDDGAFEETITLAAGGETMPAMRARLFAGAGAALPRVALERRREPVVYDYPRSVRYEVTLRGVPPAPVEPAVWEQHADGWSMQRRVEQVPGAVRATWDATLSRTRFEPESFSELDALYNATVITASAELPF